MVLIMLILSVCNSSKLCNCINGLNNNVSKQIKKHWCYPVLYLYTIKSISVTRLSFLANSTQLTL